MDEFLVGDYKSFLKEITEKIRNSQYEAMRTLNTALIRLYWDIGKEIYEQQQQKGWGKSIVEVLADELKKEFPNVKGFSSRNLWNMRNFYVTYQADEKLQPMVAEISWTKNLVIMEKCKEDLKREFYIRTTKRYGWTKDVLINHIENQSYEKYLLNQTNFDETVPEQYREQAKLAVKDQYMFDFMELSNEHSEQLIETVTAAEIKEQVDWVDEETGDKYYDMLKVEDYESILKFMRCTLHNEEIEEKEADLEEYQELQTLYSIFDEKTPINIYRQSFILLLTAFDAVIFDLVKMLFINRFFVAAPYINYDKKFSLSDI